MDLEADLTGRDGGVLVVRVPEELGHEVADDLRIGVARHLPNRDGAAVVLDMQDVRLISSIGIAALLQILELCQDRGAALALCSVPEQQLQLLRMLQLEGKFRICADADEARLAVEG